MFIHAMSRERALRLVPNKTCSLLLLETAGKEYAKHLTMKGWNSVLPLSFYNSEKSFSSVGETDESVQDRIVLARALDFTLSTCEGNTEDLVIVCDDGCKVSAPIVVSLHESKLGECRFWDCVPTNDSINSELLAFAKRILSESISTSKSSLSFD